MTGGMLFTPDGQAAGGGVAFDPDAVAAAAIAKRQEPYKLLKIADIHAMQDPEYLLNPMLPKTGLTVMFGPSGTFKSFVAFDWSLCVAAGVDWFGRKVQQAPVVYLAGEGVGGLKLRLEAWQETHPFADAEKRFHLLPNAVNLLDPDEKMRVFNALQGVAEELAEPCGLLVVDTMARSLIGGDENSAKDVGQFVANIDEIVRPQAVLVVHHTGKDGVAERGSSSLRGAADSMVKTNRSAKNRRKVTLSCEKSKDAEEFDDIPLVVVPTARSLTLQIDLAPTKEETPEERVRLRVLGAVSQSADPLSLRGVRSRVKGSNESIKHALTTLRDEGLIELIDGGWRPCPARSGTSGTPPNSDPQTAPVPQQGQPRRGPASGTVPEPQLLSSLSTVPPAVPDGVSATWPCETHDSFWSLASGPLVCGVCHPPPAATSPTWVERPNDDADWEAGL